MIRALQRAWIRYRLACVEDDLAVYEHTPYAGPRFLANCRAQAESLRCQLAMLQSNLNRSIR